jgi:hypothetical protein
MNAIKCVLVIFSSSYFIYKAIIGIVAVPGRNLTELMTIIERISANTRENREKSGRIKATRQLFFFRHKILT